MKMLFAVMLTWVKRTTQRSKAIKHVGSRPYGSAGTGMMYQRFRDAAGNHRWEPRDWIIRRNAAGQEEWVPRWNPNAAPRKPPNQHVPPVVAEP